MCYCIAFIGYDQCNPLIFLTFLDAGDVSIQDALQHLRTEDKHQSHNQSEMALSEEVGIVAVVYQQQHKA